MPIEVVNYGGAAGWYLRKYLGGLSSKYWYKLQYILRNRPARQYIDYFRTAEEVPGPLSIAIETMNRCNGTCPFCPANIHDESRPFQRMEDTLFDRVVDGLSVFEAGGPFTGRVLLSINNEPLMDNRILRQNQQLRERLPQAFIQLYTNGSLLTPEMMDGLAGCVDLLIVDNYSMEMRMNPPVQRVYDHVQQHPERFSTMQVTVQLRYANEILSNRNGTAPNKQAKPADEVSAYCMLPFTDMNIFPSGVVGLCCNDTKETTCLGNVQYNSLREIWEGNDPRGQGNAVYGAPGKALGLTFYEVRRSMAGGRNGFPFCKSCDSVDIGYSFGRVRDVLQSMGRN